MREIVWAFSYAERLALAVMLSEYHQAWDLHWLCSPGSPGVGLICIPYQVRWLVADKVAGRKAGILKS